MDESTRAHFASALLSGGPLCSTVEDWCESNGFAAFKPIREFWRMHDSEAVFPMAEVEKHESLERLGSYSLPFFNTEMGVGRTLFHSAVMSEVRRIGDGATSKKILEHRLPKDVQLNERLKSAWNEAYDLFRIEAEKSDVARFWGLRSRSGYGRKLNKEQMTKQLTPLFESVGLFFHSHIKNTSVSVFERISNNFRVYFVIDGLMLMQHQIGLIRATDPVPNDFLSPYQCHQLRLGPTLFATIAFGAPYSKPRTAPELYVSLLLYLKAVDLICQRLTESADVLHL